MAIKKYLIATLTFLISTTCSLHAFGSDKKAFINAFLIDGTGAEPIKNMTILVEKDKIVGIGKTQTIKSPRDAQVIDLQGKSILPGFFNSHVHKAYDAEKLKKWAQEGVTTVRDLGRSKSDATQLRDQLNKDNSNARLVIAGPLVSTTNGYGSYYVSSPEDAVKKTNQLVNRGIDFVKIGIEDRQGPRSWPLISQSQVNAIISTAHSRGLTVSCHISRSNHLEIALRGGTNTLEHMIYDQLTDEMIQRVIRADIVWVPTLELYKGVSQTFGAEFMTSVINNTRRFVEAGGKIALGTDYSGFPSEFDLGMPITEIQLMRKANISPMQIIVAATRNSAQIAGLLDTLGTIEVGKIADLIVVPGNPLTDLMVLGKVSIVIKNGEIIKRVSPL